METNKLFHVLVVGGSLLATQPGCDDSNSEERRTELEQPDSSVSAEEPAADAMASTADAGELIDGGFCPNDVACEVVDGQSVLRDGFECCWASTC